MWHKGCLAFGQPLSFLVMWNYRDVDYLRPKSAGISPHCSVSHLMMGLV